VSTTALTLEGGLSGPPSLFVVSLPRSLSSRVHRAAREALGLREPAWTSSGEILNADRFVTHGGSPNDSCRKYVREEDDRRAFAALGQFLSHVVQPRGFAYKDVVQPFVVARWLPHAGLRDLRVLRIRRPLADIAWSMLAQGWLYPARGVEGEAALIQGLAEAERALAALPGEAVDYDDLITSESALQSALANLYPDREIGPVRYLDDTFAKRRDAVLRRRGEERYREIEAAVQITI
jgi:hypothetical protein